MIQRSVLIAICVAAFAGGAFAYGVDVRAALSHKTESTFIPLNSRLFRMRQPDGVERIFARDRKDPNRLHCTVPPWLGAIRPERRMINVFTAPDFKGERTEFCFVDGVLRFMSVGKKDYEFPPGCFVAPTNSIESLWPAAELTEDEKASSDMWKGGSRLRLFSRNPNRAALVFVQIALVALAVGLFSGSCFWRMHGVIWTLIGTLLMLQAQSRGGFLAFCIGVSILVFFRTRRGVSGRLLAVFSIAFALIFGFAVVTKTADRVMTGTVQLSGDASSQKRLAIWKEVPRMLAAAPWGWGLWQSGPAYNAWFEKPERMEMIGDLFNDHISRMVEGGFVMGGLYVFVWAFLFAWTLRFAWRGGSPLPLAVCAAYFVASSFNPMNWWTPGFYLPAAVLAWGVRRLWTGMRPFAWAGGVTAAVLAGVAVVAALAPEQDVPIRAGWLGRQVIIGKGEPKVWVVDDGYVLCGDYYGFPEKEIRDYYLANPSAEPIGIVTDLSRLPKRMDRLVLCGKRCETIIRGKCPDARHVVLLTPPFGIDKIPQSMMDSVDLHVLTGRFTACLTGDAQRESTRLHVVSGAEAYVPGWLNVVVRKM